MPNPQRPSGTTRAGRKRADRAAQFMPFAALTGYYQLAREQERIVEPRHELTEEEAEALSRQLMQLKKGDLVRVTYYDWDGYITRTDIVQSVEPAYRKLRLAHAVVALDDIRALERGGGAEPARTL